MRGGRAVLFSALCALLAGCGHGEPFRTPNFGTLDPHSTDAPVRITLSAGTDLWPTWLPDGSGILYTSERLDRTDRDWCLVVLPSSGGRITRTMCENTKVGEDSVETFQSAAVSGDGQLVYVRSSGRRGELDATGVRARSRRLVLGSLGAPLGQNVSSIPYTIPGRHTHTGVSQISWIAPNAIVYRGDFLGLVCLVPIPNCPQRFVQSGLGIVYQTLGEAPGRVALPGTDYASSVAVGESGDEVYYTLGGDSRVYRLTLSTLASTVIYDFGAAGIVRDVQVRGGKLVAIVGGSVAYGLNASVDLPLQIDDGGDIHVVDLLGGTDSTLAAGGRLFSHPALSPSGTRLVAESSGAGSWDLWLFEVP
ncbi:MAG: PD40 domain-containing protein [Gemmatimonadetes bacterium]|nr:PD40 domain-containing protein [Gemmatimonadota bacterium]